MILLGSRGISYSSLEVSPNSARLGRPGPGMTSGKTISTPVIPLGRVAAFPKGVAMQRSRDAKIKDLDIVLATG